MHKIHLFEKNATIYGSSVSLCCGTTWLTIKQSDPSAKYSKNPNYKSKSGGEWCKAYKLSQVGIGVNNEGAKFTVHLFEQNPDTYTETALCCDIAHSEIGHGKGHLISHNSGVKLGANEAKCSGWPTPIVPVGIGVNTKGAKFTVHLFKQGQKMESTKALCCAITWSELGKNGHLQTASANWDDEDGNAMAKCSGWTLEWLPDTPETNPKLTCMICGYPRIPQGAGKKDGSPILEGEVIPQDLYIDGMLVKVFCGTHCKGCGQPTSTCQCCPSCHKYPCGCGQAAGKPKKKNPFLNEAPPKPTVTKIVHVVPPNSKVAICCKAQKSALDETPYHDYKVEYSKYGLTDGYKWCDGAAQTVNAESIHGFYFDLPKKYKCYGCGKHMKNCECEDGPVDKHGTKLPLTTTHEGKPITIATGSMVPGWIARGQVPELQQTDADVAWPNMKPKEHDPVEWACDFYLYHAIMSGAVNTAHECQGRCEHHISQMFALENPPVLREARVLLNQVITEADLVFREYIDMACGGELRHHPSIGPKDVLSGSRSRAWAQWRDVRDLVGVRALLDMAELFVDCNATTGGVCGQKWQQAALLLHSRLTGKVKPEVFVDQVFSLVHNGGVFLNKREWKNNRLNLLQGSILPAQALDDFNTLLDYASPTAVEVWDEAWRAMNYCRIRSGVRPARREVVRSIQVCHVCGMASFQGHLRWDCRQAETYKVTNKNDIQAHRSRKRRPYFDWKFNKLWLYEYGHEGKNGPYYRSQMVDTDYIPARKLLDQTFTVPEGKRTLIISDGDYNIVKLPIAKFKGQEWTVRDLVELHGMKVSVLDINGMEVDL